MRFFGREKKGEIETFAVCVEGWSLGCSMLEGQQERELRVVVFQEMREMKERLFFFLNVDLFVVECCK